MCTDFHAAPPPSIGALSRGESNPQSAPARPCWASPNTRFPRRPFATRCVLTPPLRHRLAALYAAPHVAPFGVSIGQQGGARRVNLVDRVRRSAQTATWLCYRLRTDFMRLLRQLRAEWSLSRPDCICDCLRLRSMSQGDSSESGPITTGTSLLWR